VSEQHASGADFEKTAFEALIAAVGSSTIVTPELALQALTELRDGVITGEGPTSRGRVHFSRTLDAQDAALCAQILTAPGRSSLPVTRAEADLLFEIDAAASERLDNGRFDDLFVKAVAHHALATTGRAVPSRAVALSPETPLTSWAPERSPAEVDRAVLEWIMGHVRGRRSSKALMTIALLLAGAAAMPALQSVAFMADLMA
jgi:hypothetical protein